MDLPSSSKTASGSLAGGLLQGYQPIVWLLIVNNTLVGLAISAILKFANNLVRVFAHTAAMLLTMFLECVLMGAAFAAACRIHRHRELVDLPLQFASAAEALGGRCAPWRASAAQGGERG